MSSSDAESQQNPPTGQSDAPAQGQPNPPTYAAPTAQPYPYPQQPVAPQPPQYAAPQPPQYGAPQPPQYGAPQSGGVAQPTPFAAYGVPPQPYTMPQTYQLQPLAKKSPMLGRIALALVLVTLVVATVSMGPIATVMAQLAAATGSTQFDNDTLTAAIMSSAAGPASAFQLATLVGSTAAILGLIAGIIGRGRAAGIIAFIVGLLAPVVWMTYAIIVLYPTIMALR